MGLYGSKESNDDWNNEFKLAENNNRVFNHGTALETPTINDLANRTKTYSKTIQKNTVDIYTTEDDTKIRVLDKNMVEVAVTFNMKVATGTVDVHIFAVEVFESSERLKMIDSPKKPMCFQLTQQNPVIKFTLDLNLLKDPAFRKDFPNFQSFILEIPEPTIKTLYSFTIENSKGVLSAKLSAKAAIVNGVYSGLQTVYGLKNSIASNSTTTESCLICFSEPINTVINPCMHMCLCSGCAEELSTKTSLCPLCRTKFNGFTRLELGKPRVGK